MASRRLITPLLILLLSLVLLGEQCVVSLGQTPSVEDATSPAPEAAPADSNNEWLKRLLDLKTKHESLLEKQSKNDASPNTLQVSQKIINEIGRQIKWARQMIEIDGEFNEEAYKTTMKKIREKTKTANQDKKRKERLGVEGDPTRKELDRAIERSRRETRDEIQLAREVRRLNIEAAGLRYKLQTNPNKIGMVIWNLPLDRKIHDRLTSVVKVRLTHHDRVVWRSRSIKLDRRRPDTAIELPSVDFNKVAIDVVRWQGDGGGLAEIQVYLGNENVAARRPCEVTNIETQPTHLDDQHAVTDGVTEPTEAGSGYWIPEEKKKASVTINLLGVPVSGVTATDR